ncbi:MAG: hypothetical protein RL582_1875 [Bacteroidota bacterium]
MLKSMTGFGRAEKTIGDKTFFVELKALNGKQLDIQMKLPSMLKPFEFEIRNKLQEKLIRGTVDVFISVKQMGVTRPVTINTDLIRSYYLQIKALATELEVDTQSVLGSLLRLPEVIAPGMEVMPENEFLIFMEVFEAAVNELNQHRVQEGQSIEDDLTQLMLRIQEKEEKIILLAPKRMERIKEEIRQLLHQHVGEENYDNNRMEQELIYYMEKIDIHEEQIRLRQHADYFREIILSSDNSKGKKLSFLLQEIGREINTTGSKAYDADIQKCVVEMKDDLEKAKEQILNVL